MKLMNTIVVFDFYTVADDDEDAVKVAEGAVQAVLSGEVKPAESNALVVTREREIRQSWLEQTPMVSAGVSDADFEKLKGNSTLQIFKMLHTKEGEAKK